MKTSCPYCDRKITIHNARHEDERCQDIIGTLSVHGDQGHPNEDGASECVGSGIHIRVRQAVKP